MMVLIISCRRSEHLSCIAFLQISSVALFLSPFVSVRPQLETKNRKFHRLHNRTLIYFNFQKQQTHLYKIEKHYIL